MPTEKPAKKPLSMPAVLGFVLTVSQLIPFVGVGFVLCLIGRRQCRKTGARGKGLATAGIVLGALYIAVVLAYVLIVFFFGLGAPIS
jgi:hypothetical protein